MSRGLSLLVVGLAAIGALRCVAYNTDCEPLVPDPNETVGSFGAPVFLDKPNTRHANNAFGQVSAESYLHSADTLDPSKWAQIGVINGGGIRADGICVTRNVLAKGPITSGVLHDISPFDNQVLVMDVLPSELVGLFEQGAAGLSAADQPITNPPSNFLIPSGVTVTLNCSDAPSSRVTDLSAENQTIKLDGAMVLADDAGVVFRLAITNFLVESGAGTSEILNLPFQSGLRHVVNAPVQGGVDSYILEDYMRRNYNPDVNPGQSAFIGDGGITFVGCAIPPPPQN